MFCRYGPTYQKVSQAPSEKFARGFSIGCVLIVLAARLWISCAIFDGADGGVARVATDIGIGAGGDAARPRGAGCSIRNSNGQFIALLIRLCF